MIWETLDSEYGELQDEDALLRTSLGLAKGLKSKAERVTFFSVPSKDFDIYSVKDEDVLGYAVVKTSWHNGRRLEHFPHVYEAVVRVPPLLNNYLHGARLFRTYVGECGFDIPGTFFAQQNGGATSTCAQAACRMVLSSVYPHRRFKYREICEASEQQPAQIRCGLTDDETMSVLRHFNVGSIRRIIPERNPTETQKLAFKEALYSGVESGYPVLLSLPVQDVRTKDASRHLVTIVGHTLNSDLWEPDAACSYYDIEDALPYFPSAVWSDYFLTNDDNFGMHLTLSSMCLREIQSQDGRVLTPRVIIPVPCEVSVEAFEVTHWYCIHMRRFVEPLLQAYKDVRLLPAGGGTIWIDWVARREPVRTQVLRGSGLVLRTQIISRDSYTRHMMEMSDPHKRRIEPEMCEALVKDLPEYFWMCEFTISDLYTANKRKVGELLASTCNRVPIPGLPSAFFQPEVFLVRFPGWVLLRPGSKDARLHRVPVGGHTPLYRGDICVSGPEW